MAGHFLKRWRPCRCMLYPRMLAQLDPFPLSTTSFTRTYHYLLSGLRAGDTDISVWSWGWGGHGAQVLQWGCDVPRSTVPTARASGPSRHHTATGKVLPSSRPTHKAAPATCKVLPSSRPTHKAAPATGEVISSVEGVAVTEGALHWSVEGLVSRLTVI